MRAWFSLIQSLKVFTEEINKLIKNRTTTTFPQQVTANSFSYGQVNHELLSKLQFQRNQPQNLTEMQIQRE